MEEQTQLGPTGSTETETVTETGPTETTETVTETGPTYIITLDELITSQQVLQQKEADDKCVIDTIDNPNPVDLKAKLYQWAIRKFPDAFPIFSLTVIPPQVCSDGITRGLYDYIQFCSGMSIAEKLLSLQSKMQGIQVLNSYSGNTITIHVSKLS